MSECSRERRDLVEYRLMSICWSDSDPGSAFLPYVSRPCTYACSTAVQSDFYVLAFPSYDTYSLLVQCVELAYTRHKCSFHPIQIDAGLDVAVYAYHAHMSFHTLIWSKILLRTGQFQVYHPR
jgi:hypothetical protein